MGDDTEHVEKIIAPPVSKRQKVKKIESEEEEEEEEEEDEENTEDEVVVHKSPPKKRAKEEEKKGKRIYEPVKESKQPIAPSPPPATNITSKAPNLPSNNSKAFHPKKILALRAISNAHGLNSHPSQSNHASGGSSIPNNRPFLSSSISNGPITVISGSAAMSIIDPPTPTTAAAFNSELAWSDQLLTMPSPLDTSPFVTPKLPILVSSVQAPPDLQLTSPSLKNSDFSATITLSNFSSEKK